MKPSFANICICQRGHGLPTKMLPTSHPLQEGVQPHPHPQYQHRSAGPAEVVIFNGALPQGPEGRAGREMHGFHSTPASWSRQDR